MVKHVHKETPVMKQFHDIKSKYPNTLILFRMGDFYETFELDAKITSKILGIVLTKRSNGKASDVDLAGFPYHSLDNYLPKLVNSGHRVAICEQIENPKLSKGIVKREVVEIVTPGTIMTDKVFSQKSNNYIGCLYFEKNNVGISFIDISTGEFYLGECQKKELNNVLLKFSPSEVIISKKIVYSTSSWYLRFRPFVSHIDNWIFEFEIGYKQLKNNFKLNSLKSFGCDDFKLGIISGGALLNHIKSNLNSSLKHITKIQPIINEGFMNLDGFTVRNLEIFQSLIAKGNQGTLIDVLDSTKTAGGGRLLRKWLLFPLTKKKSIESRLDVVSGLLDNKKMLLLITKSLKDVIDIERVLAKINQGKSNPKELIALANTLLKIPFWLKELSKKKDTRFKSLINLFSDTEKIVNQIRMTINDNSPIQLKLGNIILSNVNSELDELRILFHSGKKWLIEYEQKLRKEFKISKLKIGFNRIFGYFIEVRKIHLHKIPKTFIRRQTLVNSERYITDELKSYELKILNAEEKILNIETKIYLDLCQSILKVSNNIQRNAIATNRLDLLCCFANNALKNDYVRPKLSNKSELVIKSGRHPVVEKLIPLTEKFIPNDLIINSNKNQIHLLTGPNMAGKSTYLRQIALISLMGQIGSFVPATSAKIGIVDRLFTRVGANDNLAGGESTFMVEMIEVANILNNMTPKSLILLDEVGRGTATYDGLSIAYAITEYIHEFNGIKPRTLFATHYHELTKLESSLKNLENYFVAIKEFDNNIIFLRTVLKGVADKSYGIQVAKMAGLPSILTKRASDILDSYSNKSVRLEKPNKLISENQLSMVFNRNSNLLKFIKEIDLDNTTPLEALKLLNEIKKKAST